MADEERNNEQHTFGMSRKPNWYANHKGSPVSLTLQGGVVRGGVIHDVDLNDGKVVLNPYMGKIFSNGRELEALVPCDERILISSIVSERIHLEGHFEGYLAMVNPEPFISS
jgi:hypothetical protein